MSLYSETLCHKVCKFSTYVAAVLQPVEPPEQKAWRWAKFKALSMDLLTTDREETEPRVHTHTQEILPQGRKFSLTVSQDKVMFLQSYIITYTA